VSSLFHSLKRQSDSRFTFGICVCVCVYVCVHVMTQETRAKGTSSVRCRGWSEDSELDAAAGVTGPSCSAVHTVEHADTAAGLEVCLCVHVRASVHTCVSVIPASGPMIYTLFRNQFMVISRKEMVQYRRRVIRPLGNPHYSLAVFVIPVALLISNTLSACLRVCVFVHALPRQLDHPSAREALRRWHEWAAQSHKVKAAMQKWNEGMPMKLYKWGFKTIRVCTSLGGNSRCWHSSGVDAMPSAACTALSLRCSQRQLLLSLSLSSSVVIVFMNAACF
jgi:hypothetical protein